MEQARAHVVGSDTVEAFRSVSLVATDPLGGLVPFQLSPSPRVAHTHPKYEEPVNDTLTKTLFQATDGGAAKLRLALDEQHFMARSAFTPCFEHDYWFGPPPSAAVLDDPYKIGTTVHADLQFGQAHEYPRLYVH